jgi:hypothetical protein
MLIKKEKKGNVTIYYVDKDISDDKMEALMNTYVKQSQIKLIIDTDADVYDSNNNLLLKFRKNKLSKSNLDDFYENVISFAMRKTSNRGSTSGSTDKNVGDNPRIMTNIFGYFDRFSPKQKALQKDKGQKIFLEARECKFNMDYPEKYKKTIPLIKEIDSLYKKLIPTNYAMQRKKANQTHFKIPDTSFTTITTNVNFQTTIHTDKGDDPDGFGNLTVIERGKYSGGETCLPQYGIGVNARTGDVLFMNVHEWHGNLPIKKETKDAVRLSIVCYLRLKLWEKTKNKTKKFMIKHNNTLKNMRGSSGK